jgi:hypothetical protein
VRRYPAQFRLGPDRYEAPGRRRHLRGKFTKAPGFQAAGSEPRSLISFNLTSFRPVILSRPTLRRCAAAGAEPQVPVCRPTGNDL